MYCDEVYRYFIDCPQNCKSCLYPLINIYSGVCEECVDGACLIEGSCYICKMLNCLICEN